MQQQKRPNCTLSEANITEKFGVVATLVIAWFFFNSTVLFDASFSHIVICVMTSRAMVVVGNCSLTLLKRTTNRNDQFCQAFLVTEWCMQP